MEDSQFEIIKDKEWLVTNGIGGYASSTICGCNTRRYHGLLIASFAPPTHRQMVVSKLEEQVTVHGREWLLSTNRYPGAIHPEGYRYLKKFSRLPFPKMEFGENDSRLTKTVFMPYGHNITVVAYQNTGTSSIDLQLTPFIAYRDHHHLWKEDAFINFNLDVQDGSIKCSVDSRHKPFYIYFSSGNFKEHRDWYHNLEYDAERERGLDDTEDVATIGKIHSILSPGETLNIIISAEDHLPEGDPGSWRRHEELRLQSLTIPGLSPFMQHLVVSGDQFVVWRKSSSSFSMIAGYHWFTDWGRDTMIAMRGLLIATGRQEIAKSVLLTFIRYIDAGMVPNRFPDHDEEPEYNTIDASLWLFVAIYEYYQQFKDEDLVRLVFSSLKHIIAMHLIGTRYRIHVSPEGLLYGGEDYVQLTWMDAKVGGHVVTPRVGCAVEINALWYNALEIMSFFSELTEQDMTLYKTKAEETRSAFRKYFINGEGYLNDVVIPGELINKDIRPNQIYAISLPFSPLEQDECVSVLRIIEKELYTDYGLRTLSPGHPDFKTIFSGDPWLRDHAYHQGTVWMYLWGEYALAYLRVHGYSEETKETIRQKAHALEHHFYHEQGIHCMSEVFDGAHPEKGKGCVHQAWSVGMTLLALIKAKSEE